jgi:hypothetical protein
MIIWQNSLNSSLCCLAGGTIGTSDKLKKQKINIVYNQVNKIECRWIKGIVEQALFLKGV